MELILLYLISVAVSLIPWIIILRREYKSEQGIKGLSVLYTMFCLLPYVNLALLGTGILIYLIWLSEMLANKVNERKRS